MNLQAIPPGDDDFLTRTLSQILAVVLASSSLVLVLYFAGVLGGAADDGGAATTDAVAQMPPPGSDEASTGVTSALSPADSSATTATTEPDSASTSSSAGGAPTSSPAASTVALAPAPRIAHVAASDTRPDGTDSCGEPTSYQAIFTVDRVRDTGWMVPGDGVGAAITITLAERSLVAEVGLVPGYDKTDPCTGDDRFDELRRVTAVRWTFDDGSSIVQDVRPTRTLQTATLDLPVVTMRVSMTILETTEPGEDRLDHTAVSEIVVS